jgi:hypothetical protein
MEGVIQNWEAYVKYSDYIIRDPKILDGVPIIKGTQISLKVVLEHFEGSGMRSKLWPHPNETYGTVPLFSLNMDSNPWT